MLVLSRKLGEKICIGDKITITVVDVDRGKVRLGVKAPKEMTVLRKELLERRSEERPSDPQVPNDFPIAPHSE